jgi:hypothetical protein
MEVIKNNYPGVLRFLIQEGADPDKTTELLDCAVEHNLFNIVKLLVSYGYKNSYSLEIAAKYNRPKILGYLIQQWGKPFTCKPLMTAVCYGHIRIVKYLMTMVPDFIGMAYQACGRASLGSHKNIIRYFIYQGVNPYYIDNLINKELRSLACEYYDNKAIRSQYLLAWFDLP